MEKTTSKRTVKFYSGKELPLEMHKVRIVQSLNLVPVERRLEAIKEAGFNTFLLGTKDIFLDMLTDSGTNAMSDTQLSSMFVADDAYAGSQSFIKFQKSVLDVFNKKMVLPVHQGRAAENIISQTFVKKGSFIPMNYHFTTTLAHIQLNGGTVVELFTPEAMKIKSDHPFKGNIDIARLEELIVKHGPENVPFIRMEASTNLIGGQPFSMKNLQEVRAVADKYKIIIVLDASLIGENAYFIKTREEAYKNKSIHEVLTGVEQKDISIGDPISHIFGHNYDIWHAEFPDIVYADRMSENSGRTLIKLTQNDLLFYSDHKRSEKLYDMIEDADYMINMANLKPHGRAGISLTAKNHFGSQGGRSAFHLHYSLISPVSLGKPTNNGYRKYRVFVDIMGSRYLGQNTMLFIVDGLYGGGSNETKVPVKYFMPPFNNDWANSLFMSQDQVALESVCYDFLRNEWNGTSTHSSANNEYESLPDVYGVDDYLHQAADPSWWPEGMTYDPDNTGKALSSLGVHEHWNDRARKQYSGNLGKKGGIELISVPDTLVRQLK